MTVILLFLALLVTGCQKKSPPPEPPKVDNTVTRYADNLKSNVGKAEITAEKANQKIAETNQTLNIE